jgi:polynucleotide 5'-kinase involved in rRNA processing
VYASGCIIDSPGHLSDLEDHQILKYVDLIKPSHIIILDHDHLANLISENYKDVQIHKMKRADDTITYDEKIIRRISEMRIANIFFNETYLCSRDQIPVSELNIFKVQSNGDLEVVIDGEII